MMKDRSMMQRAIVLALASLSAFLFPGCVKYYELMKGEMPQGECRPDKKNIYQQHIKSCTLYDQFKTLATFDILWLSDQIKSVYVNQLSSRHGKNSEERDALLRRQLEENNLWVSFIVLSDIRESNQTSLCEKDSAWSIFLQLNDDQKIRHESIKEIDLDPEYQLMFGSRFNQFKKAYLIKFPAKPLSGEVPIEDLEVFKMVISSVKKVKIIKWQKNVPLKKAKEIFDEDLYWG